MSTSPTPSTTTSSLRHKKVLVPKVWKRPHSTIYGKNVEFGSSLYSDKIGEINGRKFNSELPWSMRNSGGSTSTSGASYNQGYLSTLATLSHLSNDLGGGQSTGGFSSSGGAGSDASSNRVNSYADLLEMTNPHRFSKKRHQKQQHSGRDRIDFYDKYEAEFNKEIDHLNNSSLLANEPLLRRKFFDNYLDYDHELGLFVPTQNRDRDHLPRQPPRTSYITEPVIFVDAAADDQKSTKTTINKQQTFNPIPATTTTTSSTKQLLPKYECQLSSSPYGQSADGRKLSLGSINPASYRPSLPQKTSTAHASDGEEFEFQDKSSPFYTDR